MPRVVTTFENPAGLLRCIPKHPHLLDELVPCTLSAFLNSCAQHRAVLTRLGFPFTVSQEIEDDAA